MEKLITVFTPTYNRISTLPRLYHSLNEQSSNNFEWLIIDDGSDDDTEDYINHILQEAKFDIIYLKQENQGKHVAFNRGVIESKSELFFCVDSDDYLVKDAIKVIEEQYCGENFNTSLAGMVFYRKYEDGKIIGTEFPVGIEYAGLQDLYDKGKRGDTALIYRTSVLKQYPFPVFDGERFLRESIIWGEIDKKYVLKVVREAVYVTEYRVDGLSRNAYYYEYKCPRGAALYRLTMLKKTEVIKEKIYYAAAYMYYKRIAGESKKAVSDIGWLYSIISFPASFLYSYRIRKASRGNLE